MSPKAKFRPIRLCALLAGIYAAPLTWADTEQHLDQNHVSSVAAKRGGSILISPQNSDVPVEISKFAWTATTNAQAYRLCVGSVLHGWDLFDSGECTADNVELPPGLPMGTTLYATLSTKINGRWFYSESHFRLLATSYLLRPRNATELEKLSIFSWEPVDNASAYYLYVGTEVGAKDIYDGGETSKTSVEVKVLPKNRRLYARINTKIAGYWHFSDSTFVAVQKAVLTQPAREGVLTALPIFKWKPVDNADTYRLCIGSETGGSELFDTGPISRTEVALPNGVVNQPICSRLYTRIAGRWHYSDKKFFVVSPSFGENGYDIVLPRPARISWASIASADAYYLYVGSIPGSKDLYDSGETPLTSATLPDLPVGKKLFARINVKVRGTWYSSDATITVLDTAKLDDLPPDAPAQGARFTWKGALNSDAYRLCLGSSPQSSNIFDSGAITGCSANPTSPIPVNQPVYATLYSKTRMGWYHTESSFSLMRPASPDGPNDDPAHGPGMIAFSWHPVAHAEAYRMQVWSGLDRRNYRDSGETTALSFSTRRESPDAPLSFRLSTRISGKWFSTDRTEKPSISFISPMDGEMELGRKLLLRWSAVWGARSYDLTIGTSAGASDVCRSGPIPNLDGLATIANPIDGLPLGVPLFATVVAKSFPHDIAASVRFEVPIEGGRPRPELEAALWAMRAVHSMIGYGDVALPCTYLDEVTAENRHPDARCSDYAMALNDLIKDYHLGQSRILQLAMANNGYDVHTLVEYYYPPQSQWIILDPTFNLVARRRSDGGFATADDISRSARNRRWNDLEYDAPDHRPSDYYLDYPLLYLNVLPVYKPFPIMDYLSQVSNPTTGEHLYIVKAPSGKDVTVRVDGIDTPMPVFGDDGLTVVFAADTVELPDGNPTHGTIYRLNRNVFRY